MLSRKLFPAVLIVLLFSLLVTVRPAAADSSHARIIRLSVVQGDVRFARMAHGDPMTDASGTWETAEMNLPIRQGYVLATDHGRAEVEFENGAMAFLKENTVLEFYDLSLNDSARTTRLVLLQGSASFYVNLGGDDYFSVTGGDFTVEAIGKCQFRVDNYDDGSTVETYKGIVSVLHKKEESRLVKGQSLSMKAGDDSSVSIGTLPEEDDFDRWVSGITENASNAQTAATQYTGAGYYVPGIVDLYTYGAFTSCGAYGLGWRPFGAGLGWSPFSAGQWIWDPAYGWTWLSSQPWGWVPYHYGGWAFDNSCGWFYSPPFGYGYGGYPGAGRPIKKFPPRRINPPRPVYHPVTAVFVRQGNKTGIVPMHPLDEKGKTPLNLEHGVFTNVGTKGIAAQPVAVIAGEKWETLKSAPKEAFSGSLAATERPDRVSRTLIQSSSGARIVALGKDSSIAYDPVEHRFVNTNSSSASASTSAKEANGKEEGRAGNPPTAATNTGASRTSVTPSATRSVYSPPARNTVTPPAPRYSGGGGGSSWSGSASSGGSSAGRSSSSSASSGSSASASSHPSGGRPH
jgi:hypothetical protein